MEDTKKWFKSKGWGFWIIIIIAVILAVIALYYIKIDEKEPNLNFLFNDDDDEVIEEEYSDQIEFIEDFGSKKSNNKREEKCRRIFESIYQAPFGTCKPDFLKSPKTGRNLELDGYNADLKIAFEYNGIQHYQYPNPFHRTEEKFQRQLYNDRIKRRMCDELGIYLISIPYHIKDKDLRSFIISKLPRDRLESLESIDSYD